MYQEFLGAICLLVSSFGLGLIAQYRSFHYLTMVRTYATNLAIHLFIPLNICVSLWQLSALNHEFVFLPFMGFAVIFSGALSGVLCCQRYTLNNNQIASVIPISSIYNWGALGSLIIFFLFGELGIALLALFKLFEELIYFGWVFPFAKFYSNSNRVQSKFEFVKTPALWLSIGAVLIGGILNGTGVSRPSFVSDAVTLLVPLASSLLIFSAGSSFSIKCSATWIRFATMVSIVRVIVPLNVVLAMLSLFNLWDTYGGVLAKVSILLSLFPAGFIALLPTTKYNLDKSLASLCWLMSYLISFLALSVALLLI